MLLSLGNIDKENNESFQDEEEREMSKIITCY